MTAAPTTPRYTPEDLLKMPKEAGQFELVNGQLLEKPVSAISQVIGTLVAHFLNVWAGKTGAGLAISEADFRCFADEGTVRKPDVAFLSSDRLSRLKIGHGFFRVAPDLAIEVLSPSNSAIDIEVKRDEYFSADVRQVWIVNPDAKSVTIHRPDGSAKVLHEKDELVGDDDLLPGFRCKVADVFTIPAAKQN